MEKSWFKRLLNVLKTKGFWDFMGPVVFILAISPVLVRYGTPLIPKAYHNAMDTWHFAAVFAVVVSTLWTGAMCFVLLWYSAKEIAQFVCQRLKIKGWEIHTLFRLRLGEDDLATWARALLSEFIVPDPLRPGMLDQPDVIYFRLIQAENIQDDVAGEGGDAYKLVLHVWDWKKRDFIKKIVAGQFDPVVIDFLVTETEDIHAEMRSGHGLFTSAQALLICPNAKGKASVLSRVVDFGKEKPKTEDVMRLLARYEISG